MNYVTCWDNPFDKHILVVSFKTRRFRDLTRVLSVMERRMFAKPRRVLDIGASGPELDAIISLLQTFRIKQLSAIWERITIWDQSDTQMTVILCSIQMACRMILKHSKFWKYFTNILFFHVLNYFRFKIYTILFILSSWWIIAEDLSMLHPKSFRPRWVSCIWNWEERYHALSENKLDRLDATNSMRTISGKDDGLLMHHLRFNLSSRRGRLNPLEHRGCKSGRTTDHQQNCCPGNSIHRDIRKGVMVSKRFSDGCNIALISSVFLSGESWPAIN
jgi:hypothetical protein